jgi:rubrerythrin
VLTNVETFKKALHNEVRAQVFYRMAADATRRDDCAMVFMGLAEVEDDHARQLVDRVGSSPQYKGFDAPSYLARLEESVDATVPPKDEKIVREGDVSAILKLAKRFEIESRDTYRALARGIDDAGVKAFCEELSRMEEDHLREIVKLERSMAMPQEERPAL